MGKGVGTILLSGNHFPSFLAVLQLLEEFEKGADVIFLIYLYSISG